ncbi:MAG: hypothetical protein ABI298_09020, partial [Acidimicrobiales bacterium]
MRRLICAILLVAGSVGIFAIPVSADPNPVPNTNQIILSFDFSDNTSAASASQGPFNVIVDVLPGGAAGLIRMFAVAPTSTNDSNLVCRFHVI